MHKEAIKKPQIPVPMNPRMQTKTDAWLIREYDKKLKFDKSKVPKSLTVHSSRAFIMNLKILEW